MTRICIHILLLIATGLCPAIPGHLPGPRPYLIQADGRILKQWTTQLPAAVVPRDSYGERHESGDGAGGSIPMGARLLSGQTDKSRRRRFRGLERFTVSLLFSAGLALVGLSYWRRQNLRHRIWSLRISPQSLHELIKNGHSPLIIDLRSPLDMLPDPRMIPGAIRITQEEIPLAAAALPRDGDLVLYCTCPREKTSIDTALGLLHAGFTRVRLLSGGFQAWKQLGYELQNAADMIRWPSQPTATPGLQSAADILLRR